MQLASPRGSRRAGRASLGELVAWDVGLLILVGMLLVGEQALSRGGAPVVIATASPPSASPSPARPDASPFGAARRPPQPSSSPRRRRGGPGRFAREDSPRPGRQTSLQEFEGEVRRLLVEGDPDGALAALANAEESLRSQSGWDELRRRVHDSVRVRDALVAALVQLEAAADRGDLAEAQAIVAGLPGAVARKPLEVELELARARASASGGFEVTGFVPGELQLEGSRARLSGPVDRKQGQPMLAAVEAVLAQAGRLGLKRSPDTLEVRLQAPDAPRLEPGSQRVVTVVRTSDGVESLCRRLRWHAARWAVETGGAEAPAWLRRGLTRVLAGSLPAGGGQPQLSAAAKAWRRLFVIRPPLGDGSALLDLLSADDPDPVRSWALTWFAWYGQDPNLAPLQAAVNGRSLVPLDAPQAADLERAWLEFLEAQ